MLRDLAAIAADPSHPEYRNIEVVGIEMRSPLKVTLSLFAISADAIRAFQDVCRDIILHRERGGRDAALSAIESGDLDAKRLAIVTAALGIDASDDGRITAQQGERLLQQIKTLQNAEIALRRVEVRQESA